MGLDFFFFFLAFVVLFLFYDTKESVLCILGIKEDGAY